MFCLHIAVLSYHWENLFGHSHSGRSQRELVQYSTPSGYSGPALHR